MLNIKLKKCIKYQSVEQKQPNASKLINLEKDWSSIVQENLNLWCL